MSQRRSNNRSNVEEEEMDQNLEAAITECVRYIVCREGNKVPLKRAEIAKHLSNTCQTASNSLQRVVSEANKVLKRVYGYKLVQVAAKSGIQFIVVLDKECESLPACTTDSQHRRLLVAALTHIYMSGGPVKEDEMWKFLAEAGLLAEEDHNGRKILTNTMTRQMYLTYSKEGEGELARSVFKWGQRAEEEVRKIFLLQKMAEAFQKTPDHWGEQYREATTEPAE